MTQEVKPKKKKKGRAGIIIFNIYFWLFFGCVTTIIVFGVLDERNEYKYPLFGFRMSVVSNPSMETVNPVNEAYITADMKRVAVNDTIFTQNYGSFEDIQVYDIATYYKNGELICNRIIDKYENEQGQFLTFRGDANNTSDAPVKYEQVRGKVVNIMSHIGPVISFLKSIWGKIIIFSVFILSYIGSILLFKRKRRYYSNY